MKTFLIPFLLASIPMISWADGCYDLHFSGRFASSRNSGEYALGRSTRTTSHGNLSAGWRDVAHMRELNSSSSESSCQMASFAGGGSSSFDEEQCDRSSYEAMGTEAPTRLRASGSCFTSYTDSVTQSLGDEGGPEELNIYLTDHAKYVAASDREVESGVEPRVRTAAGTNSGPPYARFTADHCYSGTALADVMGLLEGDAGYHTMGAGGEHLRVNDLANSVAENSPNAAICGISSATGDTRSFENYTLASVNHDFEDENDRRPSLVETYRCAMRSNSYYSVPDVSSNILLKALMANHRDDEQTEDESRGHFRTIYCNAEETVYQEFVPVEEIDMTGDNEEEGMDFTVAEVYCPSYCDDPLGSPEGADLLICLTDVCDLDIGPTEDAVAEIIGRPANIVESVGRVTDELREVRRWDAFIAGNLPQGTEEQRSRFNSLSGRWSQMRSDLDHTLGSLGREFSRAHVSRENLNQVYQHVQSKEQELQDEIDTLEETFLQRARGRFDSQIEGLEAQLVQLRSNGSGLDFNSEEKFDTNPLLDVDSPSPESEAREAAADVTLSQILDISRELREKRNAREKAFADARKKALRRLQRKIIRLRKIRKAKEQMDSMVAFKRLIDRGNYSDINRYINLLQCEGFDPAGGTDISCQ